MPCTTEIVSCPLVAGSDIQGDPVSLAATAWKHASDLVSQQAGFQQMSFGMHVENADTLQNFLDWESVADCEKFTTSEAYLSASERLGPISAGTPQTVHVDFKPEGGHRAALLAPITEVATFYFDGQPPENAFEGAKKLLEAIVKDGSQKVHGWAYGITHEAIEKDGVKGKAGMLVVGWDSVASHNATWETQALKDNIDYLKNEVKGIEMHHIRTMQWIRN